MARKQKKKRQTGHTPLPGPLAELAEQNLTHLRESAKQAGVRLPQSQDFTAVLARVMCLSEFVADSLIEQPQLLRQLLDRGQLLADYSAQEYHRQLSVDCQDCQDEDDLERVLRDYRRAQMLRIAWRDLAGWASLSETLRDLSALADASVEVALSKLDSWHRKQFGTPKDQNGHIQELLVLAMGKLGGRELNFSSDIDLIFVYPEAGQTRKRGGISNEEYFTYLAQALIRVLDTRTQQGFVFRVDARLRPFGESGALVWSFDGIEDYYQTQGREWERYAMIKARVIAGAPQLAQRLYAILRPFVYRRYLDYSAFGSLRVMKRLISRQVERKGMQDNIKLGPGGIREIEFIGQAFQLIRGGREPILRARGIRQILWLLTQRGYLPDYVSDGLIQAYEFLRRSENHLQAIRDQQVHRLPTDELDQWRLAVSMGFSNWEAYLHKLDEHRQLVQGHFEQVFAAPQADAQGGGHDRQQQLSNLWHDVLADDDADTVLRSMGYHEPAQVRELLEDLREGLAFRSAGSQGSERLDRLMPLVLGAVAEGADPDESLPRIAKLLEAIAGRTTYLSLLVENPMALSQLVKLCDASAWIAELLAQHPVLMDELLDPRSLYQPLRGAALQDALERAMAGVETDDLESQMEVLRHFKQTQVLYVAAADVAEAMPLMVVSDHLTEIAEVIVRKVVELCYASLVNKHGHPPGHGGRKPGPSTARQSPGFCVVAYGKFGGIELGYGSDLDLVFLHDQDDEAATTAGKKPVPVQTFYGRMGQRIIHMLNTLTPGGILYEVDMRLRPSGASGLLVSSIQSFEEYQKSEAWTWEHQALVRARPVAGDPVIAEQFLQIRETTLRRKRKDKDLRAEVRDMRERMRRELANRDSELFDLKQGAGGITDIEFLVQYAVLRWASQDAALCRYTDNIRILEAMAAAGHLTSAQAERMAQIYRRYRRRIHHLTLAEQKALVPAGEYRLERAWVRRIWSNWMEDGPAKIR